MGINSHLVLRSLVCGSTDREDYKMVTPLLRVLYIDNDQANIHRVSTILSSASLFHVETAPGLEEGLNTLRNEPVDVILLNVDLPDSQGLGTLERVQRARPNKPIVALTPSDTDIGHDVELSSDGAQAYLSASALTSATLTWTLLCALERHQAEKALRESESCFRTMFEQAPIGIAHIDLDGRFFLVNQKMCDIVGFSQDELLQQSLADITHADDVETASEVVQSLLAGEQSSYTQENRWRHKYGGVILVKITMTLARTAAGEPQHFFGVVEDITWQQQAEEAQFYLAAIVESSADGIIGKSLDGTIRSWNAASERMYGYTAEEVIGRSIRIIFPPGAKDEFDEIFDRIRHGERIERFETQRARKDGQIIDVALTISPIKDSQGKIIGASGIERDISNTKSAQAALAESEVRLRQLTENTQDVLTLQDARTREMLYVSPAYEKIWGRAVESLYTDPASFLDAVRPDDREMLIAAMKNQGEDNLDAQYRIAHPSGEERWIHTRTLPIHNTAGEVYRLVGISEDITEYKRLATAEHDQRVLAEALRQAANALTSTLDMTEVLDRILSGIERVVPHTAADIMLISEGVAQVVDSRGYEERDLEESRLGESYVVEDTPYLAYMRNRRQSLIIPDVHEAVAQDQFKPSPAWFWHSYVGVPIRLQDEVLGFINLGSIIPYFFTPVHADRLEAFAEHAAIAIQNARLHQQARDLATHRERQRLAHDLHDAVSQTLFSAAITAEALARQWERNPDKVGPQIDDLRRLTRGALAETRAALLELRPTALYEIPFESLAQQLVEAAQSRKKLDILTRLDHSDELPPQVKQVFYRITQEALNNIIKHTQATQVEIRFRWRGDKARLVINDDGQGFDSEQIAPTSLGMGIMRERAESVGAQLDISSAVGEGTRITLTWKEGEKPNHE
jgi:PAS domain S-box-containing protein